jgi:hypothetical protein
MRTQEVMDKAVTGTLMLILKWFKVSRKLACLTGWMGTNLFIQTYSSLSTLLNSLLTLAMFR